MIIALALELFLYRTRPGKAIRAVADNREAAELMGISSTAVLALAFAIGIALAASSGALVSTLFPFTILSGASLPVEELRGDGSGRTGQALRRAGCRSAAGPAGRSGDSVHRGQLDSADRVRPVRGCAGRCFLAASSGGRRHDPAAALLLDHPGRLRRCSCSCRCTATMFPCAKTSFWSRSPSSWPAT